MVELHQDHDSEIAAIVASTAALSRLADAEARRRVLSYVLARCLPEPALVLGSASAPSPGAMSQPSVAVVEHTQRELPGIACLTEAGEFRITACALEVTSRLAAAVRLAQIAIYAHERLTGRPLSSRKGLTPLLKAWGALRRQ